MRRLAPVLLFTLAACSSLRADGARTANALWLAEQTASPILDAECVQTAKRAKDEAELAKIQARCDVLSSLYRTGRLTHAALVAALAGGDDSAILLRSAEAAAAGVKLGEALAAMRDRP